MTSEERKALHRLRAELPGMASKIGPLLAMKPGTFELTDSEQERLKAVFAAHGLICDSFEIDDGMLSPVGLRLI